MFASNKSEQQMCQMLFYNVFDSLTLASDDTLLEHSTVLAECIQDIGLSFSARLVVLFFLVKLLDGFFADILWQYSKSIL